MFVHYLLFEFMGFFWLACNFWLVLELSHSFAVFVQHYYTIWLGRNWFLLLFRSFFGVFFFFFDKFGLFGLNSLARKICKKHMFARQLDECFLLSQIFFFFWFLMYINYDFWRTGNGSWLCMSAFQSMHFIFANVRKEIFQRSVHFSYSKFFLHLFQFSRPVVCYYYYRFHILFSFFHSFANQYFVLYTLC